MIKRSEMQKIASEYTDPKIGVLGSHSALEIMDGDEIIAPAHSWISTTSTITQAGGKVVFCDTDVERSKNIMIEKWKICSDRFKNSILPSLSPKR